MANNPDTIAFGEWRPDQSDRRNTAQIAKGVRSNANNYAPFPAPNLYQEGDADTDTRPLGMAGVYDSSLSPQVFMGDTTKLFWLVSRVATDISKGGGYSIGADDWWAFEQFGDYVVAVADNTAPQVYQMGVSSLFADLGGSPPANATTVARVNDFLWMGKDFTCYWSAFNDITDWTPSVTTQAGSQLLDQAHGRIQQIVGGEYATIFQERSIRRAMYVGGDIKWDFGQDAVETRRGCIGPHAAVRYGRNVYFCADDGFYVFDGNSSTSIGAGKVDDYFQRKVNYGYRQRIRVGIDSIRKVIVWGVPFDGSEDINFQLIYSLTDGRWTYDDNMLYLIGDLPVEAYTVDNFHLYETSDDLDTTNLDDINIDSNAFDERRRLLGGINRDYELITFSGSNRPAIVETPEFEAAPGRRAFVSELWPMGDFSSENVSASVGRRNGLPGGSVSYGTSTAMNNHGYCPQRVDGRFLRARVQIAAGGVWNRLEGVHHTSEISGER